MSWFHKIKESFTFTSGERKGIIVLLILIFLVLTIPPVYKIIFPKPPLSDDWKKEIALMDDSLQNPIDTPLSNVIFPNKKFTFNPNTASEKELKELGFSSAAIKNLLNYRAKNGVFFKKEDIKKIYGISSVFYSQIEPYIDIPDKQIKLKPEKSPINTPIVLLDLNTADSLQLVSLKGIGPAFTRRILKFRDCLGGFYSIDQMKEIYGMNDSILEILKKYGEVHSGTLKKLKINSCNQFELSKHPYITKYQAFGILKYRQLQGGFKNNEEVLKSRIFSDSIIHKILPYLDYN